MGTLNNSPFFLMCACSLEYSPNFFYHQYLVWSLYFILLFCAFWSLLDLGCVEPTWALKPAFRLLQVNAISNVTHWHLYPHIASVLLLPKKLNGTVSHFQIVDSISHWHMRHDYKMSFFMGEHTLLWMAHLRMAGCFCFWPVMSKWASQYWMA